jgi:DNA-binding NtrC family response regulator
MNEPRNAQTQIISLTSVDLLALVEAGRFDADLFYRLNTIHLKVQDL